MTASMQAFLTHRAIPILLSIGICLAFLAYAAPARADIAPPRLPPGSNIAPGTQVTYIQMASEKVVIDFVSPKVSGDDAWVTASFTMHNPTQNVETLQVRFPLNGDPQPDQAGSNRIPVIDDFIVNVNGIPASTQVITLTQDEANPDWPGLLVWAVFEVTFPARQDTIIQVNYTLHPTNLGSLAGVSYIFGTGAGWAGPIGLADLVIRFPYDVDCENIICGQSGPTPSFVSNVAVWHWESYEPDPADVLNVSLVKPGIWKSVLDYRKLVENDPYNAISWRELAHQLNQAALDYKGFLRTDEGAGSLVEKCVLAYEKWVSLQPNVAASHSELAAFLWSIVVNQQPKDAGMLAQIRQEVSLALELDPQNAEALDLNSYLEPFAPEGTTVIPTETSLSTSTLPVVTTPVPTATQVPTMTDTPTSSPQPSITFTIEETQTPSHTPRPTRTASVQPTSTPEKLPSSTRSMGIDLPFLIFAVGIAIGLGVLIVGVWWMERRG